MILPVIGRVKQLCATTLFKLQVEKNDIGRIKIIASQFKKNVIGLFQRLVFCQAVIQIHAQSRLSKGSS